jgi:FAD/FMN-containing dehydrogenase
MTIDPVSTGNPGWSEFGAAYNGFCSNQGGTPLFNQTYGITPAQAQKAWGDKLKAFAAARRNYDPNGRLLNDYFRDLLGN